MRAFAGRLLCLLLFCCGLAQADPISFAAFGDMPYRDWERQRLPLILDEMGREKMAFIVHVGDIKSGGSRCADGIYLDILGQFQSARHPLIYIPGDNEWTDCWRKSNGGFDPRERLARLRRLFYPDNFSLGQPRMAVTRQSQTPEYAEYRENMRWIIDPLLFVTANVTGSENNIVKKDKPSQEFAARNAANLAWLKQAFALARERSLPGIVIFIQANAKLERAGQGDFDPGFADFQKLLIAESLNFPGQVLLVHGDTHYHRIDKPLSNPATNQNIGNFTRVEVYGSPFLGWVKITASRKIPGLFHFESRPFTEAP